MGLEKEKYNSHMEEEEEEKQEILVMKKNRWCCWLDLPHEILELIMKRLYYADLLNFRVVCKSWNSSVNRSGGGGGGVTTVVPPLKQSPWLLLIDKNKLTQPPPGASTTEINEMANWLSSSKACSCKLFDPVYKKTYTINNMNININLFLIQRVYASKHGWILSSVPYNLGQDHTRSLVFAYTPFSTLNNNFIKLPVLSSQIQLATFTSNPSIMDCLFLVLTSRYRRTYNNYVHISMLICTCRPGDKWWSTQCLKYSLPVSEFDSSTNNSLRRLDERWIYSEGNLYYIIHLFGKQQQQPGRRQIRTVRVVKWECIMKKRPLEKLQYSRYFAPELYGSVMNKEWDPEDDDDLLSKLEKDQLSNPNEFFVYPDFTAGTEYESCTNRKRKMVKIDPPHT